MDTSVGFSGWESHCPGHCCPRPPLSQATGPRGRARLSLLAACALLLPLHRWTLTCLTSTPARGCWSGSTPTFSTRLGTIPVLPGEPSLFSLGEHPCSPGQPSLPSLGNHPCSPMGPFLFLWASIPVLLASHPCSPWGTIPVLPWVCSCSSGQATADPMQLPSEGPQVPAQCSQSPNCRECQEMEAGGDLS